MYNYHQIVEEREDGVNVNNWHWREKNCMPWTTKYIQDKFKDHELLKSGEDVVTCGDVKVGWPCPEWGGKRGERGCNSMCIVLLICCESSRTTSSKGLPTSTLKNKRTFCVGSPPYLTDRQ